MWVVISYSWRLAVNNIQTDGTF